MRYIFFASLLILSLSSAYAETYSWTDSDGVHFTDNYNSIPKKFIKQAVANAMKEAENNEPQTRQYPSNGIEEYYPTTSKKEAKKAKQFRRGRLLSASEAAELMQKHDGCYLNFSVQPGKNVPWRSSSYLSGVIKIDAHTEDDCLKDCIDNAQNKELDAVKGWNLFGTCNYYEQQIWRK